MILTKIKVQADIDALSENYKTRDIDALIKRYVKERADVSALRDHVLLEQQLHRIYLKPIAAGATAPPLTPQGRANTPPGIIKYAFWRRTAANPNAVYCCLNLGEASAPEEIAPRSICFDRDIREVDGESIILRIDPLLYAPPRSGAFFFFGFGTAVTGRSARTTAAASPGLSTSRI